MNILEYIVHTIINLYYFYLSIVHNIILISSSLHVLTLIVPNE